MCVTVSFFAFLSGRGIERFGFRRHLGIFMYLRTALGFRKIGRCILFCFCCITLVAIAMATTFQIGGKQCKRTIYLKSVSLIIPMPSVVTLCRSPEVVGDRLPFACKETNHRICTCDT